MAIKSSALDKALSPSGREVGEGEDFGDVLIILLLAFFAAIHRFVNKLKVLVECFPLTPPSPKSFSLGGEGKAGLKPKAFSRSRVSGCFSLFFICPLLNSPIMLSAVCSLTELCSLLAHTQTTIKLIAPIGWCL